MVLSSIRFPVQGIRLRGLLMITPPLGDLNPKVFIHIPNVFIPPFEMQTATGRPDDNRAIMAVVSVD